MNEYELKKIIKTCYRLPWSKKDNPNGWIEPTTFCQLKCLGCYRGLDKENMRQKHEDISDLKKQIDNLISIRNIQTLSIAGGEPLLYPKIKELLNYAKIRGLRTLLYTNGLLLNKKLLIELKNSGTTQILIHIDKHQKRDNYRSEKDLLKLREHYCNIFREVGGVSLGFIQPLSADSLEDIDLLVSFYRKNLDVVSLIVFTLYREICWNHIIKQEINTNISVLDVVSKIKNKFIYNPCAFLASNKNQNDLTWLFSILIGFKDQELGFLDGKIYKFIQERYRKVKVKYLFISRKNKLKILKLIRYLNHKCVRNVFKHYFKTIIKNPLKLTQPIYFQTMLILRGPERKTMGWDLCQGCPDAMFYRGKLVPSCILEDIKNNKENYGI